MGFQRDESLWCPPHRRGVQGQSPAARRTGAEGKCRREIAMQIQGYQRTQAGAWPAPLRKGEASSSFSGLLENAARKPAYEEPQDLGNGRVRIDLWQYYRWRETREPIEVPSHDGWTEENIAFLKDRYPGTLSPYERLEAVDTMLEMGCITIAEYRRVTGTEQPLETIVVPAGETTCVSRPLEDSIPGFAYPFGTAAASDLLAGLFRPAPIGKADTLDKLFEILDAVSSVQRH